MADDLARFNAEPAPPEFMTLDEAAITFLALQRILKAHSPSLAMMKACGHTVEREMRHNVTTVVEEISMMNLSPARQEILSEHLFRKLGDLSSAIDNLRLITEDLMNSDIQKILARYEGRD